MLSQYEIVFAAGVGHDDDLDASLLWFELEEEEVVLEVVVVFFDRLYITKPTAATITTTTIAINHPLFIVFSASYRRKNYHHSHRYHLRGDETVLSN